MTAPRLTTIARWVVLLVVTASCKTATSQQQLTVEQMVEAQLGKGWTGQENSSHTFLLATQKEDTQIHFLVVRLSDRKIVVNETTTQSVAWQSDRELRVTYKPGMVKRNGQSPTEKIISVEENSNNPHQQ